MTDFDFDATVEAAWRDYREALTERLDALPVFESFTVEQSGEFPEGPHGVLTFSKTRSRRLRCVVRHEHLHPDPECFGEQIEALAAAGWHRADHDRMVYDVEQRRADELSAVAVAVLRGTWDVAHPTFLDGGVPARREADFAVGVVPESPEELKRLVIEVCEALAEGPITVDADGDIPLPTGAIRSWLRVDQDAPTIEYFGTLVETVPDPAAAADYVARESGQWVGIKFALVESALVASLFVDMSVFHQVTLTSSLGRWLEFVRDDSSEIVDGLAGTASDGDGGAGTHDRLPDPLQTLIVLDTDSAALDAHEVAVICRHDQSAILEYIRLTQEQYLNWRTSADEAARAGDREEAAACQHEERAWRATTEKLQEALRIVALGDGDRQRPALS